MATPTPQGISALLRKAGFERSFLRPPTGTRWDGRPDSRTRKRVAGFEVRAEGGDVSVIWRPSSGVGNLNRMIEDRNVQLRCYAHVIADAGYSVETVLDTPRLIVTAKPASLLAAKDGDPR
jgi:hypothetical protein